MIIAELNEAIASRTPVVLATVVDSQHSVPRRPGSKMLVYAEGRISGTIGGGEMEARVIAAAVETLDSGLPRRVSYSLVDPVEGDPGVCGGTVELYLEPYLPQVTLLVGGAGEVAAAIAELADWLGYETRSLDHGKTAPIPADFFALAIVLVGEVESPAELLAGLLEPPTRRVGVHGSGEVWERVRAELLAKGLEQGDVDRIVYPLGLDIGADSAVEAALSILGRVIDIERGTTR